MCTSTPISLDGGIRNTLFDCSEMDVLEFLISDLYGVKMILNNISLSNLFEIVYRLCVQSK